MRSENQAIKLNEQSQVSVQQFSFSATTSRKHGSSVFPDARKRKEKGNRMV
jgi:hypothetical protein